VPARTAAGQRRCGPASPRVPRGGGAPGR
jgi:hypothetical protein